MPIKYLISSYICRHRHQFNVRNPFKVLNGLSLGLFYKSILGCFKSHYYVTLNKYTIYFYDSQRNSINQCDKPKLFFNIPTTTVTKAKDSISFKDGSS